MPVRVAELCGVFAVLALFWTVAQRVGDYRNKTVARILALIASLLTVWWIYLVFLWIFEIDIRVWLADHRVAWTLAIIAVVLIVCVWQWKRRDLQRHCNALKTTEALRSLRDDSTPVDQKTMDTLVGLLDGAITQLRDQPFHPRFPWHCDETLRSFVQWSSGTLHGFLDEGLERLRSQLHDAVKLLCERVHMFSTELPRGKATDGFRYFEPVGAISDMAAYDAHRNEVFEAATSVCKIYDDLVLIARRTFAAIGTTRQITPTGFSEPSDGQVGVG